MSRSLMRIHHPTSVRSLVFSPCTSHPLQAVVGLENGSIYRWDLQMGQRGQLDRLPVAHNGTILSLDWCSGTTGTSDDGSSSTVNSWIVSGSLDHTVKVCLLILFCLVAYAKKGLGLVGVQHVLAYTPQANVYATFSFPRTSCPLAARLSMRTCAYFKRRVWRWERFRIDGQPKTTECYDTLHHCCMWWTRNQ